MVASKYPRKVLQMQCTGLYINGPPV